MICNNFYFNISKLSSQELEVIQMEGNYDISFDDRKDNSFLITVFYENENIIINFFRVMDMKDYILIGKKIINDKIYYQAISYGDNLFSLVANTKYKKRLRDYIDSLNLC